MTERYDVIVVGTGPAGVSAADPLAAAGLNVLLVDAEAGGTVGVGDRLLPPDSNYLDLRFNDPAIAIEDRRFYRVSLTP